MRSAYTIILSTYNEARRLERTLELFTKNANIVVIDNHSTDETVKIARRFTDKVFLRKNPGWLSPECYQFRFDVAPTNYILNAYVGRFYPDSLLDLYEEVAKVGKYKAVAIYTQMYSYACPINSHGRPYVNPRGAFQFFDKRYINLAVSKIHSELPFTGSFSEIFFPPRSKRFCVCTFRDDDCYTTELKYARYSSEDANARFLNGERTSLRRAIYQMLFVIFRSLIWRGAILQGAPGIITSFWSAVYSGSLSVKIWELQNNLNSTTINKLSGDKFIELVEDQRDR